MYLVKSSNNTLVLGFHAPSDRFALAYMFYFCNQHKIALPPNQVSQHPELQEHFFLHLELTQISHQLITQLASDLRLKLNFEFTTLEWSNFLDGQDSSHIFLKPPSPFQTETELSLQKKLNDWFSSAIAHQNSAFVEQLRQKVLTDSATSLSKLQWDGKTLKTIELQTQADEDSDSFNDCDELSVNSAASSESSSSALPIEMEKQIIALFSHFRSSQKEKGHLPIDDDIEADEAPHRLGQVSLSIPADLVSMGHTSSTCPSLTSASSASTLETGTLMLGPTSSSLSIDSFHTDNATSTVRSDASASSAPVYELKRNPHFYMGASLTDGLPPNPSLEDIEIVIVNPSVPNEKAAHQKSSPTSPVRTVLNWSSTVGGVSTSVGVGGSGIALAVLLATGVFSLPTGGIVALGVTLGALFFAALTCAIVGACLLIRDRFKNKPTPLSSLSPSDAYEQHMSEFLKETLSTTGHPEPNLASAAVLEQTGHYSPLFVNLQTSVRSEHDKRSAEVQREPRDHFLRAVQLTLDSEARPEKKAVSLSELATDLARVNCFDDALNILEQALDLLEQATDSSEKSRSKIQENIDFCQKQQGEHFKHPETRVPAESIVPPAPSLSIQAC